MSLRLYKLRFLPSSSEVDLLASALEACESDVDVFDDDAVVPVLCGSNVDTEPAVVFEYWVSEDETVPVVDPALPGNDVTDPVVEAPELFDGDDIVVVVVDVVVGRVSPHE